MNPLSVSLSVCLIVSLAGVIFFSMPARAIGDDEDGLPDSLTSGTKDVIKWLEEHLVDGVMYALGVFFERVFEFIGSVFQWFMDLWISVLEYIRDAIIGLFDPYIEESNDAMATSADLIISTFIILCLVFIVRIIKWILDLWAWLMDIIPVV